jgi:hypothetical protein
MFNFTHKTPEGKPVAPIFFPGVLYREAKNNSTGDRDRWFFLAHCPILRGAGPARLNPGGDRADHAGG